MVKVTDKDYYMDGYLQKNLDIFKKIIDKDWDMVGVIDGTEGGGKSVLAQQIAYYLDDTFIEDRIVFRHYEFRKAVINAKPKQAIIWDEALSGLNSRTAMTTINITIVDLLAEIRQKNLFILIVLPTFFDLDKYVAVWRARFLIQIYHKRFQRGYFSFFNSDSKRYLFVHGKKTYNYACANPNFRGRFTNFYTVDEQSYRKRKYESLRAMDKTEGTMVKRYKDHLKALFHFMKIQGYTNKELFVLFNEKCVDPLTIRSIQRFMGDKPAPPGDT